MKATSKPRLAGALAAVVAFAATLFAPVASAQTVADVEARDSLIASQEALLNVYRCMFGVDTEVVPGGCVDGKPTMPAADPQPFTGTPTAEELAARDNLIGNQEALLNVYRCLFDIDTQIVPGGCEDGKPNSELTPESTPVVEPTPVAGAYPLTAEELGCEAVSPPVCEIGSDGNPVALRLMSYDEVDATGEYSGLGNIPKLLSEVRPTSIPDIVALGYITECLAEWPSYQFTRYERDGIVAYFNKFFIARPISICNALWRLPVMAIDHMGADVRCVWDRFKAHLFNLEPRYSDYQHSFTGWAEVCDSWLDPIPELPYLEKCINLLRRVSPAVYEAMGLGNATIACTFVDTDFDIYDAIELRGRCAALRGLNNLSRRFRVFAETNEVDWDESQVLPKIPGNAKFIC